MIRSEKVIVVDVDGTLTGDKGGGEYRDVAPCVEVIERLKELKRQDYWIILNTSRNMRSHNGNIGLILRHTAPVLIDWLARHDIPYDELHFGKPWCGDGGFYVDDRAIRPREFVDLSTDEIEQLLKRDQFAS